MAYKVPAAKDADWFKMALLQSVLSGPGLMGGAAIGNKTSRLYKALVLTELAADVDASLIPTVDPYLMDINATVREGRTLAEVEAALDAELERIRREDISQAELDKAKKQARALFAYSTEGVSGQAFWLAFSEVFDSYEWFEHYVERLSAVTVADVREAAQKYLDPRRRTVGWYVPTGDGSGEEVEEA